MGLLIVDMMEWLLSDTLTVRRILPENAGLESDPINVTITLILFLATFFTWLFGRQLINRLFSIVYAAWVTMGLIFSVVVLVVTMPARAVAGAGFEMLWDALIVWGVNVVIFAVWYWLVDSGGFAARRQPGEGRHDFIFPQQANQALGGWDHWAPGFIDYLFLAFNTSTAFSPTDTLILSYRAKLMTMLQSTISLVTVAALAGYAVNVLAG